MNATTQTTPITAATILPVLNNLLSAYAEYVDAGLDNLAQASMHVLRCETIPASAVLDARRLARDLEALCQAPAPRAFDVGETPTGTRALVCMDACRGIPTDWLTGKRFQPSPTGTHFNLQQV